MREVTIGNETRNIDCNAYTVYLYSELKGGADLKNVLNSFQGDDIAALPMNTLLEVFYVMEKTVNKNVGAFPFWLSNLPVEALDLTEMAEGWIVEVIDLLTETFFHESLKAHLVADVKLESEATE